MLNPDGPAVAANFLAVGAEASSVIAVVFETHKAFC